MERFDHIVSRRQCAALWIAVLVVSDVTLTGSASEHSSYIIGPVMLVISDHRKPLQVNKFTRHSAEATHV